LLCRSSDPALWSLEGSDSLAAHALARNLERAVGILKKVIDQTVRRVIKERRFPHRRRSFLF
jgi:hypothetical protein